MKRSILIIFSVIVLLFQTACSSQEVSNPNVYTVTKNGVDYTVDNENKTITDEENIYYFTVNNDKITIIYPDGSSYGWTRTENGGYGGYSLDYDEEKYIAGNVLYDILIDGNPDRNSRTITNSGNVFAAIILIIFGIWNLISPESLWYLNHGWKYKNAEPSEIALAVGRVGGIVALVVAIMLLISSC